MRILSFYLIVLLFSLPIFSQTIPTTKVDSMLTSVDKSQFTSQFLYDRTPAFASLNTFNSNENLANAGYFEQAYLELSKAKNSTDWQTLQELKASFTHDSIEDQTQIGIINAVFHHLNYNSDDENLGGLRIANERFEVLNNGNTLFEENHVLIVSPTKSHVRGSTIHFNVDSDLLFESASGKKLQQLTANFETNQEYTLIQNGNIQNQSISIEYAEAGYKTLTFNAQFEDGSSISTQSVIHVKTVAPSPPLGTTEGFFNATIPYKGYDEPSPILGKLFYRIYHGNPENKILKPIIIIDGFDPGDKRKIEDDDSMYPNDQHFSILEMMAIYDENGNAFPLLPALRNQGYDVIFVNHPTYNRNGKTIDGGADFIERNALTHVGFYQYLNAQLTQNNSDEELIIIGPSMGGQISRYALAYMEKEAMDHNTGLWVSIDSPHLGANIPIGLQSLLQQVYSSNAAAQDFIDNQLGSPAAKQQLIEQFHQFNGNNVSQQFLNGRTVGQGYNQNQGHPFYIQYYNNLFNNGLPNSKGYPQNTRSIALANGSLTASLQFVSPWTGNEEYFITPGEIGLNARAFQNFFGGSIHISSLEAYANPEVGSYSKVSRFKKAFTDQSKYVSNINNRGALDRVPGGWFPGFQELASPIDGSDPLAPTGSFWNFPGGTLSNILGGISDLLGGAEFEIYDNERIHSFIPVISALGFKNPNGSWLQELKRNLVCTNEIPFDSYFGPKLNERHTSFTTESFNWLFKEINGHPQAPTVHYEGDDIEGPLSICNSDIVTYSVPASCGVNPESWEVSNNLQVVEVHPENDYIIVQSSDPNLNEGGYIRAVYDYSTVQKDVWIGFPSAPTSLNGPTEVHTGSIQSYTGGGSPGAEFYKWILPYPFDPNTDITNPIDFNAQNWQMWPTNTGVNSHVFTGNGGHNGYVQLIAVNSCGEGGSIHLYVEHDNEGTCTTCYNPVIPYPNASVYDFKLDFSEHPNQTYLIYLYDQYATLVYEGSSNNIEKTIDTLSLPNGTYFLHIHENNNVTIKQLMVQH